MVVWAEAEHKRRIGGLGRYELFEAETLVIWTAPASLALLQAALERVQPRTVILVAADPQADQPRVLLERLAGLVKYAIQHRGGNATWQELTAATAQREPVVRLGVEWLNKRGQVTVHEKPGGELILAAADSAPDDQAADEVKSQFEQVLKETSSYRAYFMRAENPVE